MRNLHVVLLATLCFVFTESLDAQKKLAILGSSTSACDGPSDFNNCYVVRLRTFYNQSLPNDTAIDNGFSVPGYNCYRGMPTGYIPPYSAPEFQPDPLHNITAVLASHPDVIVVNYPTNGYANIPVDSILFCLRTIRSVANKAGIPCFVTTTQPRTQYTPDIRARLKELKDSIVLEMGFFAIDFWTGLADPIDYSILPAFANADGIHLNDAGHAILAQRVIAKNIFSVSQSSLPVTFLQFNTSYKNNSNVVSWSTAKETDVAYYEIQRSADGISFSKIATVNANNSAGNSQYQYTDDQPFKDWNYYKIVVVNKDDKKEASPVMKVLANTGGKLTVIKAFAASSSQLVVEIQNRDPQNAQFQIFNNMGMLVSATSKKIEAGNTTLYLNAAVLSSGVYHLKVITASESAASSFIK